MRPKPAGAACVAAIRKVHKLFEWLKEVRQEAERGVNSVCVSVCVGKQHVNGRRRTGNKQTNNLTNQQTNKYHYSDLHMQTAGWHQINKYMHTRKDMKAGDDRAYT